jgi:hypothetical protein
MRTLFITLFIAVWLLAFIKLPERAASVQQGSFECPYCFKIVPSTYHAPHFLTIDGLDGQYETCVEEIIRVTSSVCNGKLYPWNELNTKTRRQNTPLGLSTKPMRR